MNAKRLRPLILSAIVFILHSLPVEAASVSGSRTTNVSIPDGSPGAWVSSQISISSAPAGATVTGIDVSFECIHPYSGDLVVDLNADSTGSLGNRTLWNREGGSADNPSRTVTGISTFNGVTVNRTWYLYARDYEAGDSGYIDEWTITIYYTDSSPPPAPSLTSPGSTSSPGTTETDFTPRFRWSASSGATGYGLYIRDLTTGTLIYDNDDVANSTSLTLPSGYMVAGHQYRWNMRAKNASGWSSYSSYRYFQMQQPISSVNPAQPVATGSAQPFTISGANFISTATVDLEDVTTGEQFYNRTVSSRSGSSERQR